MDRAANTELAPRFVDGTPMTIAGFSERVTAETWDKIDRLWWRFPAFFERYGEAFDPQTGTGGIEVWLPIK